MLTTTLYTKIKGREVGVDKYGNRYYEEKFWFTQPKDRLPKRWVLYRGVVDGSKSAPEWQGWLHFTTDQLPKDTKRKPYEWEKEHLPNLTGTKKAYRPKIDTKARSYVPWKPTETES